jgi:ADP-heptose:LPS heptosyltransferase
MKRGSKRNRLLDFYVGIPLLALAAGFRPKHSWPEIIGRIGILVNPALGDTLLCTGPIRDIRLAFPKSELIFLAARSNSAVANLLPGIDKIEMISVTNPLKSIRKLRALDLDLLVDFTSWQRITALITAYSGARFVVGYRTATQYRHFGYDKTVEHRRDRHELDNHRALARSIGATAGFEPQVVVPPGQLNESVETSAEIIVFHAWPSGTRSWLREWPQERWVEVAKALNRPGRLFVITGSPQDEPRSENLRQELLKHSVNAEVFVGRDGLASVARLLLRTRLLVSVNTGIMHLGAILGTPTVSINGPNAQRRWGPVGPCVAGLDTPDGFGGFLHLGFEFDGNPSDAMDRISAQQVLEAAQDLLECGCPQIESRGRIGDAS